MPTGGLAPYSPDRRGAETDSPGRGKDRRLSLNIPPEGYYMNYISKDDTLYVWNPAWTVYWSKNLPLFRRQPALCDRFPRGVRLPRQVTVTCKAATGFNSLQYSALKTFVDRAAKDEDCATWVVDGALYRGEIIRAPLGYIAGGWNTVISVSPGETVPFKTEWEEMPYFRVTCR